MLMANSSGEPARNWMAVIDVNARKFLHEIELRSFSQLKITQGSQTAV